MNGIGTKPNKLLDTLQVIQLAVTVALAILTFRLNQNQNEFAQKVTISQDYFKQQITSIETALKLKQDERAAEEANEKLRFQLFLHVVSVLDKKENAEQQRLAGRSLVTSLLDTEDNLRIGLLQALSGDPKTQAGQKINSTVENELNFRAQEDASQVAAKEAGTTSLSTQGSPLRKYVVDVFTCERDGSAFKEKAAEVVAFLSNSTAQSRLRILYDSINSSPGYRVSKFQLRYTSDEQTDAETLRKLLLNGQKGGFSLRLVKNSTPNYLSIFLCS